MTRPSILPVNPVKSNKNPTSGSTHQIRQRRSRHDSCFDARSIQRHETTMQESVIGQKSQLRSKLRHTKSGKSPFIVNVCHSATYKSNLHFANVDLPGGWPLHS